jgi:hypothetical protein
MKKNIFKLSLLVLTILGVLYARQIYIGHKEPLQAAREEVSTLIDKNGIKDGDLIFQVSLSSQSKAIQLATHSQYSHCGIIYKNNGQYTVFEAIQPVRTTPLDKWIARGEKGHYVIKRLKNAEKVLTPTTISKMKQIGNHFKGKNYDLTFEWSDDKIYCSELIWKIYQRATGIELGQLEKLSDFDLTNDLVRKKMKERYGARIPLNETVISPAAIFESAELVTVGGN